MSVFLMVMLCILMTNAYVFRMPILTAIGAVDKPAIERKPELSWCAQEVIKANNTLDADSRIVDIEGFLKALDTKYGGKDAVDAHTAKTYSSGHVYQSWSNCPQVQAWMNSGSRSYSGRTLTRKDFLCPQCEDYKGVIDEINKVVIAQNEQKRAMEIAGVQFDLDRKAEIMAHLANERQVTVEVTKEITSG